MKRIPLALASLAFPVVAWAQQLPTPSPDVAALQATVMDQVQALVKAHAETAALQAQNAELQKQLDALKKDQAKPQ